MEEIIQVLEKHLLYYPKMQPQDCVKLLYQNEFGPGHSINEEKSLLYLQEELKEETQSVQPEMFLPIGNHFVRVDLQQAIKEYTLEDINTWFVGSGKYYRGSMASFMQKLKTFKKHASALPINFSQEELDVYLAYYRGSAYPAVHHSDIYRENYHPHYRVIFANSWKQ